MKTKLINGEALTEEQCLIKHERLIWNQVKKFFDTTRGNKIENGDLFNEGAIGMILAYRNFEPERGLAFSTYAVPSILGKILLFLRDDAPPIKRSRKISELVTKIKRFGYQEKNSEEIAQLLEVNVNLVSQALKSMEAVQSLEGIIAAKDKKLTFMDTVGAEQDYTQVHVNEFIASLSDRRKKIVYMTIRETTQRDISKAVKIAQPHVSRELKKIGKLYQEYCG